MIVDQGFGSVKVASYDCASYQLLRELKDKFGEIVISTGSTFDDEVQHASLVMKGHPNWSLLHCVTLYPTPISKLNLGRLAFLRDLAPRVGYSDHSSPAETGLTASMVACALGASLLERHFTILPPDATRDGVVSVTPKQFRELSSFAKLSHESQHEELLSRGIDTQDYLLPSDQTLSHDELLNRNYYRGRFATPRHGETTSQKCGIYNWEETKID
jgi:N,N'-diacetyllegionaminate synthase